MSLLPDQIPVGPHDLLYVPRRTNPFGHENVQLAPYGDKVERHSAGFTMVKAGEPSGLHFTSVEKRENIINNYTF